MLAVGIAPGARCRADHPIQAKPAPLIFERLKESGGKKPYPNALINNYVSHTMEFLTYLHWTFDKIFLFLLLSICAFAQTGIKILFGFLLIKKDPIVLFFEWQNLPLDRCQVKLWQAS
jgi:hypothetical protein